MWQFSVLLVVGCLVMNITPQFVKSPPFIKFERVTGPQAYKYITLLGMYCQQSRSPDVTIEDPLDLEILLDVDSGGDEILKNLLRFKLIEETQPSTYSCTFFIEQNKQLLSNWNNGAMKARKAKAKKQTSKADDELDKFMETDYWRNTLSKCAQESPDDAAWEEVRHG